MRILEYVNIFENIFMENKKTTVYIEPSIFKELKKIKQKRQSDNPRILITYKALINELLELALKNQK